MGKRKRKKKLYWEEQHFVSVLGQTIKNKAKFNCCKKKEKKIIKKKKKKKTRKKKVNKLDKKYG